MTDTDYPALAAELREIAEAANPDHGRPWEWGNDYPQRITRQGDAVIVADCFESPDHPSVFAEYIATFDPPTVLALLDHLDALTAERDRLRERTVEAEATAEEIARLAAQECADHEAADAERDRLRAKVQRVEALVDEWTTIPTWALRAALEGPDA